MKILDNIQKSIFEILSLIQADAEVRKLVYFDTKDALSQVAPTIEESEMHFTVSPVFDVTQSPFDKNTIISVVLQKGNFDEDSVLMRNIIKITVLTRSALWELDSNKIRPLELSNIIASILNNKKTSSSHKLLFSNLDLAVLNENVNGYTLTFFLEEGSGLDEQF